MPTNPIYGNQNNYSISGSRPVGMAFLLDNTDIGDFFNHGTGSGRDGHSLLGVEAIAEFQLLTNTYGAQFGGTGAVVNMASRSGTNRIPRFGLRVPPQQRNLDTRGVFHDVDANRKTDLSTGHTAQINSAQAWEAQ